MNSIFGTAKFGSERGGRPPAAVEISPEGVLAAALSTPDQRLAYAPFQPLAAGAIVPGIGEPNVRAPEAVVAAVRTALGQVSPRNRAVTLVLPDTVVRVFVLDFDSLPSRAAEVNAVLRFRLRKIVPFEVEHAALTYQTLKANREGCKVLVAVMPGSVLTEYEAVVREAGYEPGAVLSSTLAALEAFDSTEPMLIANMSPLALTTAIAHGHDLLLYRTIDLPTEPGRRLDEVQRGIAVAAAYFEDKLVSRPRYLHYAGVGNADSFARWINHPELSVVELAHRPESAEVNALHLSDEGAVGAVTFSPIVMTSIAGVAGALAGVR